MALIRRIAPYPLTLGHQRGMQCPLEAQEEQRDLLASAQAKMTTR